MTKAGATDLFFYVSTLRFLCVPRMSVPSVLNSGPLGLRSLFVVRPSATLEI